MNNNQNFKINFENIFNIIPFSIIITNQNLIIEYSNLVAKEKFNFNLMRGRKINLLSIFSKDTLLFDTIKRVKKEKKPISIDKVDLSGPLFFYPSSDVYISIFEDNKIEKFIIVVNNKILDQADKFDFSSNRSLSGLSKMLAHEIKNPLSGIRGSAQLLSSELSDDNYELTNIIIQETDRINKIIHKIEYLFSNELIEPEKLNIHEIIDHAIKISQSSISRKVIFKKLYDPSLPLIMGNKNLLIQSFLNIIKNACEAIENDKRGLICFKTFYSLWEPKAKYLGSVKRITPIHIEITDNGNGVPDFIKNSLFNPFITSKNNGSGLGLTQVIGAMNAHSGKVEYLHSNAETTFRLSFPEENLM
jgi:two-component system nitrogen regulation sensor histidine kinase GlnL